MQLLTPGVRTITVHFTSLSPNGELRRIGDFDYSLYKPQRAIDYPHGAIPDLCHDETADAWIKDDKGQSRRRECSSAGDAHIR